LRYRVLTLEIEKKIGDLSTSALCLDVEVEVEVISSTGVRFSNLKHAEVRPCLSLRLFLPPAELQTR
jgi:hypothetical protein